MFKGPFRRGAVVHRTYCFNCLNGESEHDVRSEKITGQSSKCPCLWWKQCLLVWWLVLYKETILTTHEVHLRNSLTVGFRFPLYTLIRTIYTITLLNKRGIYNQRVVPGRQLTVPALVWTSLPVSLCSVNGLWNTATYGSIVCCQILCCVCPASSCLSSK